MSNFLIYQIIIVIYRVAIQRSFEFMCFHSHFAEQIYMHHLCKRRLFAKVMHVNLFSKVQVKTHELKRFFNGNDHIVDL